MFVICAVTCTWPSRTRGRDARKQSDLGGFTRGSGVSGDGAPTAKSVGEGFVVIAGAHLLVLSATRTFPEASRRQDT